MSQAIHQATNKIGREIIEQHPGLVVASLYTSGMAKVKISDTPWQYSITYVDSIDLDYDGKTISDDYNRWIVNLDKHISYFLTYRLRNNKKILIYSLPTI